MIAATGGDIGIADQLTQGIHHRSQLVLGAELPAGSKCVTDAGGFIRKTDPAHVLLLLPSG